MTRIGVIGSGKSQLIAALIESRGIDVVVLSHSHKCTAWEILAIDECREIEPSVGKSRKGKGQRKANRANRWR